MLELVKMIGFILWSISALAFLGILAYSFFVRQKEPHCSKCRHYAECMEELAEENIPMPDFGCSDFEKM